MPPLSKCSSCTSRGSRNPYVNFVVEFSKHKKGIVKDAGEKWKNLDKCQKRVYEDISAKSKYTFHSKNKNLNKFLKHLRCSFASPTQINVRELKTTINFLERWKSKILRSLN